MKNYHRCALLFFLFSFLLISCPADEPEPNVPVAVLVPADFAGMCHAGYSNNLDQEFEMLDEMEAIWVHWDFSWGHIQPAEDTWDESYFDNRVQRSNAENKKIMGMLLYDTGWIHNEDCAVAPSMPANANMRQICNKAEINLFAEYARRMVKRYNGKPGSFGKVDAWFIWNEPDLQPRFWTGTQEQFFALNKAVAKAIRELDMEEETYTVLVGGVFAATVSDSWIEGLFKYGGMSEYNIDGIALHPYHAVPEGAASSFNSFKQKVGRYGYADKIWVNEMGYPTYSDPDFNVINSGRYKTDQYEGDMPEIVTKTFALLAASGARNLTWYHMFDSAERNNNDSENWFGLVWRKSNDEWIKKGGYWGYALCANNIPGKTYKENQFFSGSVPNNVHSYYFEGSDGKHTLIIWNNSTLRPAEVTITLNGGNHKLQNVVTGMSVDIPAVNTHTLHKAGTFEQTLIFLTWEDTE